MDQNNPDFIIQPANDVHGPNEGIRGDLQQPHTVGQPQHTITLTLTSPASGPGPNSGHGQGPSSGPGSLIVSGIPSVGQGIGLSSTPSGNGPHGQHGNVMHYTGSPISATPMPANMQSNKGPPNYVMAGGPGGQPLIVSGGTVLPSAAPGLAGLSAVSSGQSLASNAHVQGHYAGPAITGTPIQSGMQPKGSSQSYLMAGGTMQGPGVGGADSGDEGVPVSIHVSNNPMGPGHDSGPGSGASSDSHQSGQTEQRLKVEDALNYLDQVKYKFGNQPQVYNDFLDIMKEFKSQSIDTPGVISRVSNLFRGHPELIVGFNTFLPPGYKIEVQTHDQGSQISYRVDGVTSYVVTSMPPALPSTTPNNHPPVPPPSSTPQIIQHTTPGVPIRSVVSHPPHPGPNTPTYGGTTPSVGPTMGNVNALGMGVSNGRSASPIQPATNLAPASNNYESVGPSAFTHSFSSPFVQNAFPSLQSQPVEFNHAINYVNKIKNRFHGQPDKYKQFLEILHTYQKEQRNVKEGLPASAKHLTEHEVYAQVAKLFENQDDLLAEFGQFLPDATSHTSVDIKPIVEIPKKTVKAPPREYNPPALPVATTRPVHQQSAPKRPTATTIHPITKKPKLSAPYKDVSFGEAARYGTLHDYSFFDKVKSVFKNQEVFDNFLRCLVLFNEEVISRQELVTIVTPFFSKAPELLSWFKDFVISSRDEGAPLYEPLSQHLLKHDKITEEQALEIDFSTCKRLGASYCALPKNHVPPICSGRTALCKEVLNDVWVSFPTWSEDSTFVTSRKTQYEEYICRCEDERFELDVVIEANALTIKTFEGVARKMAFMSPEELSVFELDDTLGSNSSTTIHQRTVKRLYGDKASEIIDGLKKTPFVAVPIVLKRLKNKEEEWREAQRTFNKVWSEQVERFYLKSLDHQGLTFKQSDIRALRSKALVNEIETIFDERHEQIESQAPGHTDNSPHLALHYRERSVLDDACNLLLHHVRRQSGIQKDDKRKIKQLLKHFIPDLFNHTRMELSDDENDDGSHDEHDDRKTPTDYSQNGTRNGNKRASNKRGNGKSRKEEEDDRNAPNQASGSHGHGGKGEAQESRRTLAKRELKQSQSEGSRTRGSHGKDGRQTGVDGSDANQGGSDGSDPQQGCSDAENKYGDMGNISRIIQVPHPDQDESYTLFYVNNAWYVFMRLHQILCERLTRILETSSKLCAGETPELRDYVINSPAVALRMRPINEIELEDYYPTFLEMVRNLLDGVIDASTYEDSLREMFGIHAYIAFTMDKVVANAVRQLQTLVSDEVCQKGLELFHQAQKNGGTGGLCATSRQRHKAEMAYQMQSEKAFADENCVRVTIYHTSCRMLMVLLEGDNVQESSEGLAKWSSYIANYTKNDIPGTDSHVTSKMKQVYLKRNIKKWKKARMDAYAAYPLSVARSLNAANISIREGDNESGPKDIASLPMPGRHEPDPENPVTVELRDTKALRLPQLERMDGKQPKFVRSDVNPVTPGEAEELEKQLTRNAERRVSEPNISDSAMEVEMGDEQEVKPSVKPVTPEEAEKLERQLEMNAKRRADKTDPVAPASSPYVIKENLQCKFTPNSYKMVFVVNSENYFYLKGALKRAKQNHERVSKQLNDDFGRWHQLWLEQNVTEDQITRCEDWFISERNSDTKLICNNDIKLPPYRPFNRYVVRSLITNTRQQSLHQ